MEIQLLPKPSPQLPFLTCPLLKSSKLSLQVPSWPSTAAAALPALFFFLRSYSPVSVNDVRAEKNATHTTPRSNRNVNRLIVTKWNCVRRGLEAGTTRSMLLKGTMLSVDGEEAMFPQDKSPATARLYRSFQDP